MLRKLEAYEEHITDYPQSVTEAIYRLAEKLDQNAMEEVKMLVERVYREGYRDGLHFMDWLQQD